jgi:hypothetical protein
MTERKITIDSRLVSQQLISIIINIESTLITYQHYHPVPRQEPQFVKKTNQLQMFPHVVFLSVYRLSMNSPFPRAMRSGGGRLYRYDDSKGFR